MSPAPLPYLCGTAQTDHDAADAGGADLQPARALRRALAKGGLNAREVGFAAAHAVGPRSRERAEHAVARGLGRFAPGVVASLDDPDVVQRCIAAIERGEARAAVALTIDPVAGNLALAFRLMLPFERGRVRLRDITPADADLLDQWNAALDPGGFNDFGPRPPTDRDALARGPLRNDRNGMLIIERIADGAPVGTIGWRRVLVYGPSPTSDAWQIGIELIPAARGAGLGAEAQRAVADYLFAATDLNRVEASTDVANAAEQRALDKAGYVREGVIRRAQFRGGTYHDLAYYSRLRDDP